MDPINVSNNFKQNFRSKLLLWYRKFGRDLPWRSTDDPYHILVSEIFLHQTQVKTVIPFFKQFLERFPTIYKLANANLEDVKAVTDGLGYKIRGQWLHNIAKTIVEKYTGAIPNSFEDLIALEGVGKYTAGAILSFAFKKRAPIVDTNVERIIRRVFGLGEELMNAKIEKTIWSIVDNLLPPENLKLDIFDFNQGIMDLGALICLPIPKCPICPLRTLCKRGKKFPRQQRLDEFR